MLNFTIACFRAIECDPDMSPPWFKINVVPIQVISFVFCKILESVVTMNKVVATVSFLTISIQCYISLNEDLREVISLEIVIRK